MFLNFLMVLEFYLTSLLNIKFDRLLHFNTDSFLILSFFCFMDVNELRIQSLPLLKA